MLRGSRSGGPRRRTAAAPRPPGASGNSSPGHALRERVRPQNSWHPSPLRSCQQGAGDPFGRGDDRPGTRPAPPQRCTAGGHEPRAPRRRPDADAPGTAPVLEVDGDTGASPVRVAAPAVRHGLLGQARSAIHGAAERERERERENSGQEKRLLPNLWLWTLLRRLWSRALARAGTHPSRANGVDAVEGRHSRNLGPLLEACIRGVLRQYRPPLFTENR